MELTNDGRRTRRARGRGWPSSQGRSVDQSRLPQTAALEGGQPKGGEIPPPTAPISGKRYPACCRAPCNPCRKSAASAQMGTPLVLAQRTLAQREGGALLAFVLQARRRCTWRGLARPAGAKPLSLISLLREGSSPAWAGTARPGAREGIEPAPVARSAAGLA